mgnify:CR=1 FL=1
MWQPRWWHWQDWTHRLAHWLDWQTCVLVLRDDRYYHHCVTCGAETFLRCVVRIFSTRSGSRRRRNGTARPKGDRHG